ncbi:hypothetical protein [Celerinatantimonas yamalensis]|uniref:Uncharacterized protein n=1 Tax=Celerinatantimonas yamalensis TaxID=559956 RepID=A0ABW9G2N5_9GAMM
MPIGSITGAHRGIRQDQMELSNPDAKANVASSPSKTDAMSVADAGADKLRPTRLSGRGDVSPSTKVTLSHSSDQTQSSQPLTYHKVYRSQPANTPDPNVVKYELVAGKADAPSASKDASSEKTAKADPKTAIDKKANNKGESEKLKSLASGALGLDANVKEKNSNFYQAGQFIKAAATVGGIVALFV